MHSIRYSWAMASLQLTTCSRIPGRTNCEMNDKVTFAGTRIHTHAKRKFKNRNTVVYLTVTFQINVFQLRKSDQVGTNENPELLPFPLSSLRLPGVTLVLHSHPQLVHLGEVHQNEVDRISHLKTRGIQVSRESTIEPRDKNNQSLASFITSTVK